MTIAEQPVLHLTRNVTAPVKDRAPLAGSDRRTTAKLKFLLRHLIPERFGEIGGDVLEPHLADAEACSLKQPDGVLAESQNVKLAIVAEQRQERPDAETRGDDQAFLKSERQTIVAKHFGRQEHRQPITQVSPEEAVGQEVMRGRQQLLRVREAQPFRD